MGFTPEQQNAIDAHGKGIIVSAGAGSGKTSVLVERLIRILSDEENKTPAERIVVVTFTKDAAAQMRQRLSEALSKKLSEEPENIWLMTQQANLGYAKISTIHSFCFDLIRDNPELAEVSSNFAIADENEEKIIVSEAIDRCLENLSENSPETKLRLCGFFCRRGELRLKETVEKLYKYAISIPFYEDRLNALKDGFEVGVDENLLKEYTAILSEEIRALCDGALYGKSLAESIGAGAVAEAFENEYNSFAEISEKLTDENIPFDDRMEILSMASFRTMRSPKVEEGSFEYDVKEEYMKVRNDYKARYKKICTECKFRFSDTDEDRKIHLQILSDIIPLIVDIDNEITSVKEEKNVISFSDAERLSLKLLCEKTENGEIRKTELAKELSEYYAEIMIDEYQDSNGMQDLIFTMLSRERTNLFVVGDIKQSIYRFRQSDPSIFSATLKGAVPYKEDGKEFSSITLNNNFRSSEDVVDFVNFVFSLLMSERVGEIDYTEEQKLKAAAQFPELDRATEIMIINEEDEEEPAEESDGDSDAVDVKTVKSESAAVALKIKEMLSSKEPVVKEKDGTLRRCEPRDFCILVRNRKAGTLFAAELENLGIRAACDEVDGYLQSSEMAVLINILRITDNPLLDIPMASVMMSAMFMITPDEMARIRMCEKRVPLYRAVCKALDDESAEYYPKLKAFKDTLDKLRFCAAGYSLEKLIRTVYDSTDYLTVMQLYGDGERKKANLRLILEYAKNYEQNQNGGLSGFIRYINSVFENGGDFKRANAASASDNVVNVKTIHKSKGLEFPFVFLCSSSTKFNKTDINNQIQTDNERGIGFKIRNRDELKYYDTLYHFVYARRNLSYLISEEMRLLYVALTRAKERLFITLKNGEKLERSVKKVAMSIRANGRITPSLAAKAESMSDWIVAALLLHKDSVFLREMYPENLPVSENLPNVVFTFPEESGTEQISRKKFTADKEKLKELSERLAFEYDKRLSETASKLTVTEIVGEHNEITLKRPKFTTHEGKLSGAEKGTATHLFMQYCDMLSAEKNVSDERDRLYSLGLLGNKESTAIEIPLIERFFKSELFKRMKSATKLERERKFLLKISDINAPRELLDIYSGTDGMLQGVIDCLFEEDDGIVVVDYKTDSSKDENALREEYAPQLILYKAALEAIYDKKVKEAVVYSFRLGKEVKISI
ncbi:MAG: helicase-exonuclease AddAB subunit AddA [Oscillospiraceae bacterium]